MYEAIKYKTFMKMHYAAIYEEKAEKPQKSIKK
jgi:hypothetical protein